MLYNTHLFSSVNIFRGKIKMHLQCSVKLQNNIEELLLKQKTPA